MNIVVRNGWIFGDGSSKWKKDVLIFLMPVLVGYGVTVYFDQNDAYFARPGFFIHALFAIFLDFPHAYSSYIRIGLDSGGFLRRKALYAGIPILSFLVIFLFANFSGMAAVSLISYINMYHSVRQEYGWVMYSRRMAHETARLDYYFDKLMIYTTTLTAIVWLHTLPARDAWWLVAGDLWFSLPASLGSVAVATFWVVALIYISRIFVKIFKGQPINLAKIYYILMIWFAWYVGMVHYVGTSWMLDFLHAASYILFVFSYREKKLIQKDAFEQKRIFLSRPAIWIYFSLVGIAYINYRLKTPDRAWLYALMSLPAVTHYILDGFIWRVGKSNPDLAQVMGFSHQRTV